MNNNYPTGVNMDSVLEEEREEVDERDPDEEYDTRRDNEMEDKIINTSDLMREVGTDKTK